MTQKRIRQLPCRICGQPRSKVSNKSGLCHNCYIETFSTERLCIKCNVVKPADNFTPTSVYCKKCLSVYTKEKWQRLKTDAVLYKGGVCEICGYNKCLAALEFHHINMEEKEFTISKVRTLSVDKIKHELDKCMLLCSNCHREIHYNYSTL